MASTLVECLTEIAENTERGDQTILSDGGTDWTIEGLRDCIEHGPDAQASEVAQTEDIYRVVAGGRPGDSYWTIVQVDEHGYDMSPAAYVERPDDLSRDDVQDIQQAAAAEYAMI